jgi:rhodanese-related sulfurtransferase
MRTAGASSAAGSRLEGRAAAVGYHFSFADPRAFADPMSFIQNNWLLILVFLVSGAMLVWPLIQRRLSNMPELGTLEVTRLINDRNPVLLDVRETKEFEGGRLPNAVHVPLSQLDSRAGELKAMTARPVVVYCARGQRSAVAARALAKLGFKEVFGLRGGITAWRQAGLPIAK